MEENRNCAANTMLHSLIFSLFFLRSFLSLLLVYSNRLTEKKLQQKEHNKFINLPSYPKLFLFLSDGWNHIFCTVSAVKFKNAGAFLLRGTRHANA